MNWIKLSEAKKNEKPLAGEILLCANPEIFAVCVVYIHGEECPDECDHKYGNISFFSVETRGHMLANVTHFMRIRNPNEVLQ